jgi:hypothetical protein
MQALGRFEVLDNVCYNTFYGSISTGLQSEIKQSKPCGSRTEEVFLSLLRTAATLEHSLAEGLKPYGVTGTQYNVLRILRGAGPRGLCCNEVRDRMITPVSDATRLLDRLEEGGYVERIGIIGAWHPLAALASS